MTKPQKLPVEEARKKFADLLDGTQFRGEHAEITRRGKPAGYLVPPEWWAAAVDALAEVKALRKRATPPNA
jgi:prevent-host-death family protein